MLDKILISAGLSFIIFEVMNFINYKRQNKVLLNINKCILQSAMMYFSNAEIKEDEMDKFKDFVMSRISDKKLDEWIMNFKVKLMDDEKLSVSYQFRRSESETQSISYEINKNIHPIPEADNNETKQDIDDQDNEGIQA